MDLREVLVTLHETLTELEDRFPGVRFAEIISNKTEDGPGSARLRRTLRRNGACEADIALVCPDYKARENALETLKADPYDPRTPFL